MTEIEDQTDKRLKTVFKQQASGMRQSIRDELVVWKRSITGAGIVRIYATIGAQTAKVAKTSKATSRTGQALMEKRP